MAKNVLPAPEDRQPQAVVFALAVAVLAAALLFGGAARRGLLSDSIPQILSLFLLLAAGSSALSRIAKERMLLVGLLALVTLPLAQLLPLPLAVASALPGRTEIYGPLAEAGVTSPMSISLRPAETLRSALSLLPALSLLAAVLVLSAVQRRMLVLVAIAVALVSVAVGMLQMIGGPTSALYFYSITNFGTGVGFFANANHFAASFFVMLPLCVAFAAGERKVGGVPYAQVGLAAAAVLLLGLTLSGSRTVILLGPLAILISYLWFGRGIMTFAFGARFRIAGVLAAVLLIAPLALGVGVLRIFSRFETQDVTEDLRWTMAAATWRAAIAVFPFGTGLGSFERIYAYFEPLPSLVDVVINHAHNDWLELLLETGVFAIAFMLLAIVWIVRNATVLRPDWDGLDERLARASVLAVGLLALHSLWDYPVRTIAISSLVGVCIGLTVAPNRLGAEIDLRLRRKRRRRRSRTGNELSGAALQKPLSTS